MFLRIVEDSFSLLVVTVLTYPMRYYDLADLL